MKKYPKWKCWLVDLLVRLLIRLAPELEQDIFAPKVAGYEAGKVGVTMSFGKSTIQDYMHKYHLSHGKAKRKALKDYKKRIKVEIAYTIGRMVEYDIKQTKNGTIVSGHVKVYKHEENV